MDLDDVDGLADAIQSRSEAQTRKAIRAWPNGTYSAEVLLDGYGADVKLKVSVIVRQLIHVDYAGTSDQIQTHPSTAARTIATRIPSMR